MGENVLSEELLRAAIPQQPATEEVIVSNQPKQPPTGEQMMNEAARAGMVQQDAQYRAAQQEAIAQQALQQNMAALANLFTDYSRPSDDIYNDTYNKLVMSGIYGDEAHRLASRKASEYSANRLARLQMGMQADGVTPDGYLTNNGMYYLTQMQGEDPAVASLYAQGYANMPKVAYDRQWDLTKGDYNAARQFDYSQRAADAQMNRQMTLAEFNKNLSMQQKIALMQAEPQVRLQIAKNFGLSDTDAIAFAMGMSRGGSGGSQSKEDNKAFSNLDKFLTNYGKMYKDEMGQWIAGRGPGDPVYEEAMKKYTDYALGRTPKDEETISADSPEEMLPILRQKFPDKSNSEIQYMLYRMFPDYYRDETKKNDSME